MKTIIIIGLVLISFSGYTQHNLLGKSQAYITNLFQYDPEYIVNVDTISPTKAVVKCKTTNAYPYYTYELNLLEDKCISYGFVSKNQQILRTHVEVLDFVGKVIERDSSFTNFVYEVESPERKVFYSVKQPFAKSEIRTRRDIYYILVTEETKNIEQDED